MNPFNRFTSNTGDNTEVVEGYPVGFIIF